MIAVIPAAGECVRFGGIPKECLPDEFGNPLLQSAVERAKRMGCYHAVVVTSLEKAPIHQRLVGGGVTLVLQDPTSTGLWGAIRTTFSFHQDSLLVLPDTVFHEWSQFDSLTKPVAFGLFETENPGRYSVLHDGRILTKNGMLQGRQAAWGCVAWKKEVIDFWKEHEILEEYRNYDQAFQDAAVHFGYDRFPIEKYRDLGTFGDYRNYLMGKPC